MISKVARTMSNDDWKLNNNLELDAYSVTHKH